MAAVDTIGYNQVSNLFPCRYAETVTPSDSTDLTNVSRRLWVGVSGDIRVTPLDVTDGSYVTIKAAPVGWLDVRVKRVWSTGTTATNMTSWC